MPKEECVYIKFHISQRAFASKPFWIKGQIAQKDLGLGSVPKPQEICVKKVKVKKDTVTCTLSPKEQLGKNYLSKYCTQKVVDSGPQFEVYNH